MIWYNCKTCIYKHEQVYLIHKQTINIFTDYIPPIILLQYTKVQQQSIYQKLISNNKKIKKASPNKKVACNQITRPCSHVKVRRFCMTRRQGIYAACGLGTKKFPRQRLSHSKQFPHWPNLTLSRFVNSIHHQIGGYLCSIRQFAYHFKVKSWKNLSTFTSGPTALTRKLIHMHVNCNVFLPLIACELWILDNTLTLQLILVLCGVRKFIYFGY